MRNQAAYLMVDRTTEYRSTIHGNRLTIEREMLNFKIILTYDETNTVELHICVLYLFSKQILPFKVELNDVQS